MSGDFDQQLEAAKNWAVNAREAGWLADADVHPLTALENRSPASLFEAGEHRPLVAAFFGGTGVGKSSLLNRLAGEPIARVGVERPTSREVSIYLHESLQVRHLPEGFPVDRVRIARHSDENRRQILWIDMPDIDSTESLNRDLAIDWLPHTDVLIYVVSPERYRDDKGWRLLRQHVRDHAWLFVLNQWDLGLEPQYEDFVALLNQAGFSDPMVFRTDCREEIGKRKPDDFAKLDATLQSMADHLLIEQLESRALDARREALQAAIGGCLSRLDAESEFNDLCAEWDTVWDEALESLLKGLEWPIREVARAFVQHDANPLRRSIKLRGTEDEHNAAPRKSMPPSVLWDEWAQLQLQDVLDRLVLEAGERQLPSAPLQSRMSGIAHNARQLVTSEAQRALRLSLANPGNASQRLFLKLTGLCATVLPLAAMGWVSWQAVTAYYESALTHTGFLGVDFAVHSAILVLIAWLLPFFLHRQLKPSNERAAQRGLRTGISAGLARVRLQVEETVRAYQSEMDAVLEEGRTLLSRIQPAEGPRHELLDRVIPDSRGP